ncbi:hypothetical protein PIB30_098587 [Stylosanthes scabra]|uniref:Uncharacterized protein n=1 Tax=Stylosanthes scabra TaxID=79078 RepID=A0ABU6WXT2_9FABA|nr:hypothetical protein [Stylosanthes scabra]
MASKLHLETTLLSETPSMQAFDMEFTGRSLLFSEDLRFPTDGANVKELNYSTSKGMNRGAVTLVLATELHTRRLGG